MSSVLLVARRGGRVTSVALVLTMMLAGCQIDRRVHEDLAGPLSAMSSWGSFALDNPRHIGPSWYGGFGTYTLCVHKPGVKIELQRLGWRVAEDAPPLEVQAWLRIVDRSTKPTTPFISVYGRPWKRYAGKPYPGRYSRKVARRAVTQTCRNLDRERTDRSIQPEFTELVFVMRVDKRGGELKQGYVDYLADGEPYRLVINWRMMMCGTAILARPEPEGGPDCTPATAGN